MSPYGKGPFSLSIADWLNFDEWQQLTLRLNRDYQPEDDAVSFVFTVADVERPSPSAATLVAVPVTTAAERRAGVWSATLIERGRHLLKIQVSQWLVDADVLTVKQCNDRVGTGRC